MMNCITLIWAIWATSWQNQQNGCASSEDSDQPGHPPNLIRIFAVGCPGWSESSLCAQWVAKDPDFLHAHIEDSDQTGRMYRLIRVFAGRICHFIGLVTMWLIYKTELYIKKNGSILNSFICLHHYFSYGQGWFVCGCYFLFCYYTNFYFIPLEFIWTTPRKNVSSGVSDQARHKPACAAKETS